MGLQLRVRHALGTRVIELETRGGENPLCIGRHPQADVQIPSGAVGDVEAILYFDGKQWFIEHPAGSAVVCVNGEAIEGPTALESGDVVTFGAKGSVARIEMDPFGRLPRSSRLARPETPDQPVAARPKRVITPPPPPASAPAEAAASESGVAYEQEAEAPAWTEPVHLRRVQRRRKDNSSLFAWGIGLGLVILAAGAFAFYHVRNWRAEQLAKSTVVIVPPSASEHRSNIFDSPAGRPPRRAVATTAPARVVEAVAPADRNGTSTTRPAEPVDPRKLEPEWKIVEEARDSDRPAAALWAFADYRKQHPGQFESELRSYTQQVLDRLWWMRVAELCARREQLQMQLDQLTKRIKEGGLPADLAQARAEKQTVQSQFEAAARALSEEMAYTSRTAPVPADEAQLASLRTSRNRAQYEAWCVRVIESVERHRELPWEQRR